jgi:NADPH:quinone reductase-like Zn-dependent oxidoreductase
MPDNNSAPAANVRAIGYTRALQGLPLTAFNLPAREPGPDELLVHTVSSSLNPLDYKLAELNFLGRQPPVALGFDFAGIVISRGDAVKAFEIGDGVFGMVPSGRDGVWATGGAGGLALVPDYLTAMKPGRLGFIEAGTLGVCFLSAYLAFADGLEPGATVYVPGGGGGVGHLAIQKAKALGAKTIFSSGSTAQSRALASSSGADYVFDYRSDDVATEIAHLTHGRGVDLVFDATYSEDSYVATSKMVRPGGRWVVLGVGPGKTTRRMETESPVAGILTAKGAQLVNVNLLNFFSGPGSVNAHSKEVLSRAIRDAAATARAGTVRAHVSATIASEIDAISAALADMKAGRRSLGKIAVIIDEERSK